MEPILITMLVTDAALVGCIIVLASKLRRQNRRLDGMAAVRPPVVTKDQVRDWQRKMEKLPKGCPKWRAYRNRLIEVGAIQDGD